MTSLHPAAALRERVLLEGTPEAAHAYFAALAPSTIRMGLDRLQRALSKVGDPHRKFRSVHVAGTNGKGSTCAFIASCLQQQFKTGLYTSPHLIAPNERIKINGADISDELFAVRVREVLKRLPEEHELTYFEFGTLLAFWHFAHEEIDIAVLETGLGGRLDATNLCAPIVTAITAIDFDHMEFLGDTLPLIAAEKAGIAKAHVPLIVSAQSAEVLDVFERQAKALQSPLLIENRDFSIKVQPDRKLHFTGTHTAQSDLQLGLEGPHQLHNAATALAVLEAAGDRGFELSQPDIEKGLMDARWPGRFERFPGEPDIVLDGAHNPAGAAALLKTLEAVTPGRPRHLIFGVFGDKDFTPMMRTLFPSCESVTLTPVNSPRSWKPATHVKAARKLNATVTACGTLEEALEHATAQATERQALIVIAGSLSLVGEARALLLARTAPSQR